MSEINLIHIDPESGNVLSGSGLEKLEIKITNDISKFLKATSKECSRIELKLILQSLQTNFWESVIDYQLFDQDDRWKKK